MGVDIDEARCYYFPADIQRFRRLGVLRCDQGNFPIRYTDICRIGRFSCAIHHHPTL